ncbi:uncharacterized protein PHALS_09305 [Plasmopara halstedii]|uniref:Uncharacterized protein n=1 Tax=Plasmopara halstedii TaxID=4781 RepID=A0A0P1AFG4_PLAHL|nr:uncharacterized protein PHALS_09305 [Plasmopara halstedii]CEG39253.1 hypothetical protein PHALS_09305 [Plasmopara halstedii]|eukprot:XP_024575622.1 hypothetical protein PHALS_09305 [Plasmopara halstedii]
MELPMLTFFVNAKTLNSVGNDATYKIRSIEGLAPVATQDMVINGRRQFESNHNVTIVLYGQVPICRSHGRRCI